MQNASLAINFNFIKDIRKLYKGKCPIRVILILFLNGKPNQWTVLTRLLHLHCFLDRHPYWPYLKRYGHMAIWPYCLWPERHIVIWSYCLRYGQYGCLSRKLWKCCNLVKTVHWLDFLVKNESKFALMGYFPLYNFWISFKN
jgi:hypothetical protein